MVTPVDGDVASVKITDRVIKRLANVLPVVNLDGQEIFVTKVRKEMIFWYEISYSFYYKIEKLFSFIKSIKKERKIMNYDFGYDNFGRVVFHKWK